MNINLFSVSFYKTELNIDNNKIIKYLKDLKKKDNGRNVSNPKGTGWQSNQLDLKNFLDMHDQMKPHITKCMQNMSLKGNPNITALWANVNGYKDYNEVHAHYGNAQLSLIYYLKTPKDCGKLFFENPCTSMDASWVNCKKNFTEYTSSRMTVDIKEGDLLIFPAWLLHGVGPNLNKKEDRISIASNIYIDTNENYSRNS